MNRLFAGIAAIAVVAYLVGGCAYQRSVMKQRGWRQCPNWGLWAGLFGFIGVSNRGRGVSLSVDREWGGGDERLD